MLGKSYRAWREQQINDGWSKCLEELENHAENIRSAKKIGQHEVFLNLEDRIRSGHISACSEYQKIISEIAASTFNPFVRASRAIKVSIALRKYGQALRVAEENLKTIRALRQIPNSHTPY